jgi:hypothetical protein
MTHGGADGMDVRAEHPLEYALKQLFKINDDELHRLAVFILAHALVDDFLTGHVLMQRGLSGVLGPDAKRLPREFFGRRLKRAKGSLPSPEYQIARDLNTARNDFLHRRRIPKYRGAPVTTTQGLSSVLNDALIFMKSEVRRLAAIQREWSKR